MKENDMYCLRMLLALVALTGLAASVTLGHTGDHGALSASQLMVHIASDGWLGIALLTGVCVLCWVIIRIGRVRA